MTYDGLERLQAVTGAVAEGFTLDAGSNLASRTGPAKTFTYDTSDRLTSDGTSTFTWDGADRLTGIGSRTFAYDALSRLTLSGAPVPDSSDVTVTSYGYNGDGLLSSRSTDGGTPETFLWDPLTPLARLLQIGSEQIVYGLGPLYGVKSDGSTHAFARDGMKSVRAEVDSTGVVTKSFRYTAYGDLQAASPSSATPIFLAYNSQLRDGSGLIYLRARWYEPASGRFITRDPLLGDAASPATLNAFGYGGGNPLTMSDPSGMAFEREDPADPQEADDDIDPTRRGGGGGGAGGGGGGGRTAPQVIREFSELRAQRRAASEASLRNTLEGRSPEAVRQLVPRTWEHRASAKGAGERWLNPDRPGESIRLMPGQPRATDPGHRGPYAVFTVDGQKIKILLEGNPGLR